MNKITCDIAIASNTFDQIFKQVVKELNNMGWRVHFHALPGQVIEPDLQKIAAGSVADLGQAAEGGWPVYVAIDPASYLSGFAGIDFDALKGKAVIDMTRGSLNLARPEEKRLREIIDLQGHNLLVRDNRQLAAPGGGQVKCNSLISRDYLKYFFLPRHIFTDLIWFVLGAVGRQTIDQAPSSLYEKTAAGPG